MKKKNVMDCNFPKMLYKYKSINTPRDLIYLLDIIDNHRLYMSKYSDFNDPLEGNMYDFYFSEMIGHYAGASIPMAAGKEYSVIDSSKEQFRILSLSEKNNDPLMWAHYTNQHKGVCLCYDFEVFKDEVIKIKYLDTRVQKEIEDPSELSSLIEESLLNKYYEWGYEGEWRVLRYLNDNNNCYYDTKNGLKAIIFGYDLDSAISGYISSHLPRRVKKLKTYIANKSNKVELLPFDYEVVYDGSEPPFVNDI